MLEQSGFVNIQIGPAVDTFGGAGRALKSNHRGKETILSVANM